MSQPDLTAQLRAARPVAPHALRARIAETVAGGVTAPPRRRAPSRLLLVAAAAAVLAVALGGALIGRQHSNPTFAPAVVRGAIESQVGGAAADTAGKAVAVPAPSGTRLQDYDATLSLRLRNAEELSSATKSAVQIARSLGGFATTVRVDVQGAEGDATLRLRVRVSKVQDAMERLSALGTITGESVAIQDLQAGVNTLDRTIARLQRELRALRAEPPTPAGQRRIDALTTRIERLQRGRAATVRQARLATIDLQLTTREAVVPPQPARHSRLHGAVVALEWMGIAALYALIVAGPVLLLAAAVWLGARAWRRAADRRLLDR